MVMRPLHSRCDGGLDMTALETRGASRERVLMFALVTVQNSTEQIRVRVYDLSPHGLRAEGNVGAQPGEQLEVDFRAAGKSSGVVAWRDGHIFGIEFQQAIEPERARRAIIAKDQGGYRPPWYVRGLGHDKDCIGPSRKV